jgi:hypothetical protein
LPSSTSSGTCTIDANGSVRARVSAHAGKNTIGIVKPLKNSVTMTVIWLAARWSRVQNVERLTMNRRAKLTSSPRNVLAANSSHGPGVVGRWRWKASPPTTSGSAARTVPW